LQAHGPATNAGPILFNSKPCEGSPPVTTIDPSG
jgi:hypothetical protein